MTPATTLALARAVYPLNDVQTYETIGGGIAWKWRKEPHDTHFTVWNFNPLTNPAQTLAVLCWLMAQGFYLCDDRVSLPQSLMAGSEHHHDHDNTPQSLAAAIVKAAGAVI